MKMDGFCLLNGSFVTTFGDLNASSLFVEMGISAHTQPRLGPGHPNGWHMDRDKSWNRSQFLAVALGIICSPLPEPYVTHDGTFFSC